MDLTDHFESQYGRLQAEESTAGGKAMVAARGNGGKSKLPLRCPLCSCTGHTAQICIEYTVTKHDEKKNGHRSSYNNHRGGDGGGNGGRNGGRNGGGSEFKHLNKGGNPTDVENKHTRPGCYFCEGSHKSEHRPNRLDSAAAPVTDDPMHGGHIGATQGNICAGLFASVGSSSALTAGTAPQEPGNQSGVEFWISH